jgi:alkenylglycerophosphocholine/alkenylglycerophosphoethanolamine hydrolase
VLFSWFGDVMFGMPGGSGFLFGLTGFFFAHVAYLVLFLSQLRLRRIPLLAVLAAVWWGALVFVLAPHVGALLVPVALYGAALGASASASLACNRWVAAGGIAFLVSDSVLAFKLFYPPFALNQADALIMLLYTVAQGLIIVGVTRSRVAAPRAVVGT